MADNVISDPGAGGATFATDDVGGVQYPRSKQAWGVDGVATDVAAGAAALPIQDGGNTITVDGAVSLAAALPAGTANIGDVDVLTVPAPLSTAGGGTEASALRVTIATDSTGVVSVDDNGASLTVDGTVAVSSLPALVAGAANIGDVDVLTVPAPLSTAGGGTEATALRVTIATDSTGLVSVDDNGASLTVDSGQLPAALTGGGNLKVSLAESTASQAVTGTVTANAGTGTLGTQDTASKVDDAAFVPATDRVMVIGAQADEAAPDSVDEGDAGALRMTLARGLHVNIRDDAGDSVMDGTNNAVRVNIVAGAAAGGTSATDEAAFTAGATAGTPVMGAFDDVAPDTLAEGAVGIVRATTNRALHVNLRDASGAEVSVGGGTQYDEDTASGAADKLTMAGVVRKDAAATLVDTDGDRTQLQVDASGRLHVNAGSVAVASLPALVAGTANIGDVDVLTVPAPLSTTGAGTEAAALRVTLANDSTGLISVDDNGGSLTVDGTVAVSSLPALVAGTANIGDVDVLSVVPGTGATSLGKAEDAAHGDGDTGVMALAVRKDAGATVAGTDGDYTPLQVDADGNLRVNVAVGGAGGTQYTEDAAAAANPVGTALNLIRQDALSGLTTTDGDNVAARGTDKGELYVKHVDAIPITDNAGSLTVDGSVSLASAIPAGTNNIGDVDVLTLPALVAGSANIGDVDVLTVPAPLSTSGGGTEATALRVTIANDSTGVLSVDDNGGALTVDGTVAVSSLPASTNTLEVVGDAAHDAAVSGNPVLIGAEARTTDGTAVASGDVVRPIADTLGKQVVLVGALTDLRVNGKATFTNTTAADLIAALASNKYVVTSVLVTNSHATVGTEVELRAGTTVKMQGFAAALGGGWALGDPGGLFETAANEAVTARNVTTGANVFVFVAGFKRTN